MKAHARARAPSLAIAAVAMAAFGAAARAFRGPVPRRLLRAPSSSSSPLFAKKKKKGSGGGGGGAGKGFGAPRKKRKYSLEDKSYGAPSPSSSSNGAAAAVPSSLPEQTPEEMRKSMEEFFSAHDEWRPLFRYVMSGNDDEAKDDDGDRAMIPPPAAPFLSDVVPPPDPWGIPTLEGRNPWRLLESKPASDAALEVLSRFLDEWQQSLLDIPLDSLVTGDNDRHFLEEGRRTIAVTRFHVLEGGGDDSSGGDDEREGWEDELFRTCWSELARLASAGEPSTGALVLLPFLEGDAEVDGEGEGGGGGGLERARSFVEEELVRPVAWLGREDDWEIVAMERGCPAVRMLYRLGDMPDPKDRDAGGDQEVAL